MKPSMRLINQPISIPIMFLDAPLVVQKYVIIILYHTGVDENKMKSYGLNAFKPVVSLCT